MFSSMILNETANFVKKARLVSTAHGGATNTKQLPKTTGMLLNGTLLGKHTVQQDVAWWNVVQQHFARTTGGQLARPLSVLCSEVLL